MKKTGLLLVLIITMCLASCTGVAETERNEVTKDNMKIIYARGEGGGSSFYTINLDGTGSEKTEDITGNVYSPVWSPDGEKLAFYTHVSNSQWSLRVYNKENSEIKELTNDPGFMDWVPGWAPDNQSLIFTRSVSAPKWHSEIWTVDLNGVGLKALVSQEAQGGTYSPEGNQILYFKYTEGGGDIWLTPVGQNEPVQLTDHEGEDWWPNWAPDGSGFVYQSKINGNFEICTYQMSDGKVTQLTNNAFDDEEPKYSPDGNWIVFTSLRDGHYEVYSMKTDGSDQKRLTDTNGNSINPSWMTY